MDLLAPPSTGGIRLLASGGQHHRIFPGAEPTVRSRRGFHRGDGVRKMSAAVSNSRSTSTWLTGAAGLLILLAAFVMMACAAPQIRTPAHSAATQSVVAHCGRQASSTDPARVRTCRSGPSMLSSLTKPYGHSSIMESWSASRSAPSSRHLTTKSPAS